MQTSEYWIHSSTQGPEGSDVGSVELEDFSASYVPGEEAPVQDNALNHQNSIGAVSLNDAAWAGIQPSGHFDPLNLPPAAMQNGGQIEDPHPREQSIKDFSEYLFGAKGRRDTGNWQDLLATSLNWFLLDFAFYLLNVNSAHLVPNMFATPRLQAPFATMFTNEWHTLVAISIGAVLGGVIAIKIMNNFSRKKIQMWGFWVLGFLFLLLGILYITMLGRNGVAAIVTVYVLCQLVFNIGQYPLEQRSRHHQSLTNLSLIGPNTTTFIVSFSFVGNTSGQC